MNQRTPTPELHPSASKEDVLLLYYSQGRRERLEAAIKNERMEVYPISARAPGAVEEVGNHPIELVVVDHAPLDVSLRLAMRQLSQILPHSLVIAAYPNRQSVDVYRRGHHVGMSESLGSALHQDWQMLGADKGSTRSRS